MVSERLSQSANQPIRSYRHLEGKKKKERKKILVREWVRNESTEICMNAQKAKRRKRSSRNTKQNGKRRGRRNKEHEKKRKKKKNKMEKK